MRYLAIASPTVVRLITADDAAGFLQDVADVRLSGFFEEILLHPAIELGDRCLLSGGPPCTASGLGNRLYAGADGMVRTAPGGIAFGSVGDSRLALEASAAALTARHGDLCGPADVTEALLDAERATLRGHLAALDAVRTLRLRTPTQWRVSGMGFRIADPHQVGELTAPRDDLLLLVSSQEHVLFDARARRAFRISAQLATALDVILHALDPDAALTRLARAGMEDLSRVSTSAVRDALTARGITLPVLLPAAS